MSKKGKDRVEALEEEVRKLKATIRNKNSKIRQLKSEVRTARDAFVESEVYLKDVIDGKPLSEVLKEVSKGKRLNLDTEKCPDCGSIGMKKIIFTGFHIRSCQCGYRKKINEERQITENQGN